MNRFKRTSRALRRSAVAIILSWGLGAAHAQTFSPPDCGTGSSDSTCYTAPSPNSCSLPSVKISERGACPTGYSGMMGKTGMRNACTGVVDLAAGSDESGCTSCAGPLTSAEALNIQRAVLEVSESVNLAFSRQVCSGGFCLDGVEVNDLVTGQPIGRMFRNHVWVSQDGFSSGQLPTTNRVKYLSESGKIPANSPAFSFLPKQQDGTAPVSVAQIYISAKAAAEASGSTKCSGDGKDGCSISCSQPSGGWQGQFCAAKTVQHWSCSDSYAINNGGSWQPTKDATVPFASSSPQDYSKKTWKWPDIFAWNSPSMGNSGGVVYMCNSTINACNGWVTSAATYKCRVPATYDCSYSGADSSGRPISYSGSCQTCDPAMGAKWDFQLDQANDCPATPLSTRAANTRLVWQADLAATSCPINGSGTNNNANPRQCPGGQLLDATGASCACRPGYSWDGSVCQAPPPPGSPPSLVFTPLSFSKGIAYNGVVMGSLSNGSAITSLSLPPSASPVPPGMFTHFAGSLALISGVPNTNGVYNFNVKADYAAGTDPSGNRYPAGTTVSGVSATVTGCSASSISWAQGANTCAGSVENSASVGIAPTIVATSSSPAGTTGTNVLSCNAAAGNWTSSSSSCVPPKPKPPSGTCRLKANTGLTIPVGYCAFACQVPGLEDPILPEGFGYICEDQDKLVYAACAPQQFYWSQDFTCK